MSPVNVLLKFVKNLPGPPNTQQIIAEIILYVLGFLWFGEGHIWNSNWIIWFFFLKESDMITNYLINFFVCRIVSLYLNVRKGAVHVRIKKMAGVHAKLKKKKNLQKMEIKKMEIKKMEIKKMELLRFRLKILTGQLHHRKWLISQKRSFKVL